MAGNTLTLTSNDTTVDYTMELNAIELTLSGGDLSSPVKFQREGALEDPAFWRKLLSTESLVGRTRRLVVILGVVVTCRVLLIALNSLFRFLIYSDRGPLKYIFRLHKNRTMTIYAILLNACKYLVYVIGLGYVLRELGINYTAYLASLSVVGLAIGFGSQGLVQDMGTGFFIIFESQFNIGDLVEIPPHVGIVDELGLRMTRLRNFNGQRVVIPNRNIATVANYGRAGLEAHVDVSVETGQSFDPTKKILQTLIAELQRQFEGGRVRALLESGCLLPLINADSRRCQ